MTDEPSRKKRGAENQITQDNWEQQEEADDGAEQSGPFKEAAADELAKRRIVKARRSGSATGPAVATDKPAPAPASAGGGFSWTKPVESTSGQEGNVKDGATITENGEEKSVKSADAAEGSKEESPKKAALHAFSGLGSGGGFGSSSGTKPFTFGNVSSGTTPFTFGTGPTFGFGGAATTGSSIFGSTGKAKGFGDVSSAGWAAPTKKDDEEGAEAESGGGDDEDAEKEVQVKKTDAVVSLEEVETCTGEEDETTAFQLPRAKLFVLGTPGEEKTGEEEKASPQKTSGGKDDEKSDDTQDDKKDGEKKAGDKKQDPSWVVIGIGNLKINVPKPDCADKTRRPRVIMRRQKTFQLCLNSYLFANMICDRAGPKDVRFTGMKSADDDKDKDGALATFLVRVKEEDSAQELIDAINKHKNS